MRPAVALVILSACGPASWSLGTIDPDFVCAYDIARELNAITGQRLFSSEGQRLDIVTDRDAIEEAATRLSAIIVAVKQPGRISLAPVDEYLRVDALDGSHLTMRLERNEVRGTVAHEMGHILGLKHTEHGIMAPSVNSDCDGVESQCLAAELVAQGIIP